MLLSAALIGLAAGWGACTALGVQAMPSRGWLLVGACEAVAMAGAAFVLTRLASPAAAIPSPPGAAGKEAVRQEAHRKLRHDIRGALSPALLTADRLLMHKEPAIQRAGDIMVQAIEKTAALLSDPPLRDATPPDRS